nr:zonular occludens toxin domain-containing protein [uncultured Roseateles sp.]
MPITLVTGLPGHGKTLYTLARWKDEAAKDKRPVFHNGIKELKLPGWQVWDPKDWENLPSGAIMVIDEAQFVFPIRGRGQPESWIERLAVHRHLGLDFVLITQEPMNMDSFVRRLVDRHFHIVRKFGTHWATIHEFVNGVRENVAKNRKGSIRHEWRFPKALFGLYNSAEQHTAKVRIPMRVWLLLACPVVFGIAAWMAWKGTHPDSHAKFEDQAQGQASGRPGPQTAPAPVQKNLTPLQYAEQFQPRVEGLPHTAPVYDEVTKPTQAPYPAACIASKVKCGCYSQQGTKLEVPESLCRQIADGGFFVAWNQTVAQAVPYQQQAQKQEQQPGAGLTSFGGDPRAHIAKGKQ